jgi:hypothetical protein
LIRASEASSNPRLRNIIAEILRKCLCERTYRYANCEELLDDLEIALYYALPSDIARKSRAEERWILADAEKSLDAIRRRIRFWQSSIIYMSIHYINVVPTRKR